MEIGYSRRQYQRSLGKILKTLRVERRISQEEVAALAGMDRSHLSTLEAGKHDPSSYLLRKLAAIYDLEYHDLIKLVGQDAKARAARAKPKKT